MSNLILTSINWTPRILVMEDDPDVQALYAALLANEGYDVSAAATLAEARRFLDRERFDLFVSDIMMEDGKGTDLLRAYRPCLQTQGTRILLVSGAAWYQPLTDELGADLFLSKPFDPQAFVELVKRLLLYTLALVA